MTDVLQRFWRAFSDPAQNWRQTVYVYRLSASGKPQTPYLFKSQGYFDDDAELFTCLREEYGRGDYRVLIRDGSMMVFSGDISIELPHRPFSTY